MLNFLKDLVINLGDKQKFYLSLNNESKILDIGCGIGRNAMFIKRYFKDIEYHGVDILDSNKIDNFINFKNVNLNINKLPYKDNYLDILIFTHVIEHLNNPLDLGSEINRVLKKGGRIYVEAPNWSSILVPSFGFNRNQHNPFNFYDDPTHVKPWTKHGIYEFLSDYCKLKVSKVGIVRNFVKLFLDPFIIIIGLFTGNRRRIISSFWNIYGWCVYGIGVK